MYSRSVAGGLVPLPEYRGGAATSVSRPAMRVGGGGLFTPFSKVSEFAPLPLTASVDDEGDRAERRAAFQDIGRVQQGLCDLVVSNNRAWTSRTARLARRSKNHDEESPPKVRIMEHDVIDRSPQVLRLTIAARRALQRLRNDGRAPTR